MIAAAMMDRAPRLLLDGEPVDRGVLERLPAESVAVMENVYVPLASLHTNVALCGVLTVTAPGRSVLTTLPRLSLIVIRALAVPRLGSASSTRYLRVAFLPFTTLALAGAATVGLMVSGVGVGVGDGVAVGEGDGSGVATVMLYVAEEVCPG